MKLVAYLLFTLTFTTSAWCGELTKVDTTTATKQFISSNKQAANFIDAAEMNEFIDMLKSDSASPLAQLIENIELDNNCSGRDKAENGCGKVVITGSTLTSFARGGFASAGASYRFYVGFQEEGTGHFFTTSHVFEVTEGVEAQSIPEGEDIPVEFLKTYHYNGSRDISKDELK